MMLDTIVVDVGASFAVCPGLFSFCNITGRILG